MLPRSILQYFWPALSDYQSWKSFLLTSFEWPLKTGLTVEWKNVHWVLVDKLHVLWLSLSRKMWLGLLKILTWPQLFCQKGGWLILILGTVLCPWERHSIPIAVQVKPRKPSQTDWKIVAETLSLKQTINNSYKYMVASLQIIKQSHGTMKYWSQLFTFILCVVLRFNVIFNNLSNISQQCLTATGSSIIECCLSVVSSPRHFTWYHAKYQRTNGPVKRSPDIWAKHKIKFGSKRPNYFWEKPVLIFKCKWPWAKVKKWPWTSILTYLHYLNWFQVTGCKSSEKSTVFSFSYR